MFKGYLYLAIAILGEIVGTNLLQTTKNFTIVKNSLFFILAYGICFYFLSLALNYIPLNVAYALWGALGIIVITCTSVLIWHEQLNVPTLIGLGFIIIGTLLVEYFHN